MKEKSDPLLVDVITTSSADYSHAQSIAEALNKSNRFDYRVLLTGTHLKGGEPLKNCLFLSVNNLGTSINDSCSAMSEEIQQFAGLWNASAPDICILIGDRFELLPIATVALVCGVPIAHFFGGECDTSTCIDNEVRNAITQMAHLHYVSHEAMKQRLIVMGEEAWRIQVTGNPSIANITGNANRFNKFAKASNWGAPPFIAATYLPPTRSLHEIDVDLAAIFSSLLEYPNHTVIWTGKNADPGSNYIWKKLEDYTKLSNNVFATTTLGGQLYQDLLAACDLVIGNSSSGILEAASYGLPVINLGSRQVGRLHAGNVIDCSASSFPRAIKEALSLDFREKARCIPNPFFNSGGLNNFLTHLEQSLTNKTDFAIKYQSIKRNSNQGGLTRTHHPNVNREQ